MKSVSSFDNNLNLLTDYYSKYFKYPKVGEVYMGHNLGTWVNNIRTIFNNGDHLNDGSVKFGAYVLTKNQLDKLKSAGFKWGDYFKRDSSSWERKFEIFKSYLDEFGHYPKQSENYKGINIGAWVSAQRNTYKNGELLSDGSYLYHTYKLTKEHLDKLNNINFDWSLDAYTAYWDHNFALLKEFIKIYNREPKANEKFKGFSIGLWVIRLRRIFNNGITQSDGSVRYDHLLLTKYEIDKLNEIDFKWVSSISRYNNQIYKDKEHYIRKQAYLITQFEKILELEKNEIENIEDIKQIQSDYIKRLKLKN